MQDIIVTGPPVSLFVGVCQKNQQEFLGDPTLGPRPIG